MIHDWQSELDRVVERQFSSLVQLRRHLHMHPEPSGEERETTRYVSRWLENSGYHLEYKVLNASKFGVPQNRERVFWVGTKDRKFDFEKVLEKPKGKTIRSILDSEGPFEYLNEDFTLIKEPRTQSSGLKFVGHRNKKIRKAGVRPNTEHLSRVHKQPNRIYYQLFRWSF